MEKEIKIDVEVKADVLINGYTVEDFKKKIDQLVELLEEIGGKQKIKTCQPQWTGIKADQLDSVLSGYIKPNSDKTELLEKENKKLEDYKLDVEYKPELQRRLFNYILTAVQAHSVTFEDLEVVMEMFKEVYKQEAIIKSMDGIIKPLD